MELRLVTDITDTYTDTDTGPASIRASIASRRKNIHIVTPDTTKLFLSVSRPLQRCELDSRQFKTDADGKFEHVLNTFRAIVQFTLAHQTRHRQDRLVVSGVAV